MCTQFQLQLRLALQKRVFHRISNFFLLSSDFLSIDDAYSSSVWRALLFGSFESQFHFLILDFKILSVFVSCAPAHPSTSYYGLVSISGMPKYVRRHAILIFTYHVEGGLASFAFICSGFFSKFFINLNLSKSTKMSCCLSHLLRLARQRFVLRGIGIQHLQPRVSVTDGVRRTARQTRSNQLPFAPNPLYLIQDDLILRRCKLCTLGHGSFTHFVDLLLVRLTRSRLRRLLNPLKPIIPVAHRVVCATRKERRDLPPLSSVLSRIGEDRLVLSVCPLFPFVCVS